MTRSRLLRVSSLGILVHPHEEVGNVHCGWFTEGKPLVQEDSCEIREQAGGDGRGPWPRVWVT